MAALAQTSVVMFLCHIHSTAEDHYRVAAQKTRTCAQGVSQFSKCMFNAAAAAKVLFQPKKAQQKASRAVSTRDSPPGCQARPAARKPGSGMCTQDAPSGVQRYSLESPVQGRREGPQ